MKGAVLLVTLWLLAILSLLAIGIGFRTSIDLKLVGYQIDELKTYEIAKAGIVRAISELERDESPATDTIWECGITLKENETYDEEFRNVKVGEGNFDASIEDLEGRININSAPRAVLMGLFEQAANPGEIADNIRAWRGDAGPDAPPPSAKDYSDKPYACKGAPFDVISELLLVKGITQEQYYGEDEQGGVKATAAVFDSKEFKLNVNTADQKTLEKFLDAYNLGRAAALNITEYRAGEDKDINKTEDNKFFTDITELRRFLNTAEGEGLDDPAFASIANLFTFSSNYFKIRSVGRLEKRKSTIHKSITCVVKRETKSVPPHKTEIISWQEE